MNMLRMELAEITEKLNTANLRPTRQRVMLASLLFSKSHRHVTAEMLHREAREADCDVSLATVYNTLHQFTEAKLLRELSLEGGCTYFDTNVDSHHHFLCENGDLIDIPADEVSVERFPIAPAGKRISSVDVIIRLSDS